MEFERVLTVSDVHDGPLTGVAMYKGAPHYFKREFSEKLDEYVNEYDLYPVDDDFVQMAVRTEQIFLEWYADHRKGLEPSNTHPFYRGNNAEYDTLRDPLDEAIARLVALDVQFTGKFRDRKDKDPAKRGPGHDLEVLWTLVEKPALG